MNKIHAIQNFRDKKITQRKPALCRPEGAALRALLDPEEIHDLALLQRETWQRFNQ
jgi:hypothetical protein